MRNKLLLELKKGSTTRPRMGNDSAHPRYGYAIRREKLDPMLRELAAEAPGVDLLTGETATALVGVNGRPTGVRVLDRERREREITARVVVAAAERAGAR